MHHCAPPGVHQGRQFWQTDCQSAAAGSTLACGRRQETEGEVAQRLFGTVQEALEVMCFERTALPPQQQTSDFPASDEANVAYYHGAFPGNQVRCAGRGCHTWLLMTKWQDDNG